MSDRRCTCGRQLTYRMTGGNFATGDDDVLECACGRRTTVGQHNRETSASSERRGGAQFDDGQSTMPNPDGYAGW